MKISTTKKLALITTLFGILIGLSLWLSYNSLNHSSFYQDALALLPSGGLGIATLFIILAFATSVGLPRQVAAFACGFVLEITTGALLATAAALSGCLLTLLTSRALLTGIVTKKYPKALTSLAQFFSHDTFTKTLIIRFLPAGSNLLTNILAGVAKVPLTPYLLGSGIGFLPQMFIFSMMGNGVKLADKQQLLISISLFLVAAILSAYLYKRTPNKPQLT
ncbi:TVP38/TMEM64 family protein [Thalassotalea sp. PLHSN55]|uniref:TVP38/TMEM64 family protein n=1 Tax=Thalassotalea sp. PLHSN55 TaxID=3435888 RepID=UPI003F867DC6